ncbi:hypothetical protein [Virgibacillus sp. YIM 98842]|uniref:hypothetical protein n=1 Tax=Virgibacillus sp. YIM 98842 TaxID=2663533 RepID=UPI0013DA0BC4|nr:hypothetical protein [Virgibacillus sp. YIM 98842]
MKNYPKITRDMFLVLMSWTFGFIGVMIVINIIQRGINVIQGAEVDGGFYVSLLIASNIYMIIIGIISIYFLPYYVENGVTRKDYFKGTLLASAAVSFVIPIITLLIAIVERFILSNLLNISYKMQNLNEIFNEAIIDTDSGLGSIIGDLILSVILSPNIDPSGNWILAIAVFALNIFMFYLLGWLISAGFYRGGIIIGLVFIIFAFAINIVKDTLLRVAMDLPFSARFSALEPFSPWIAAAGILILILFIIWVIRLLTKRVPIEI